MVCSAHVFPFSLKPHPPTALLLFRHSRARANENTSKTAYRSVPTFLSKCANLPIELPSPDRKKRFPARRPGRQRAHMLR
eukprot:389719-Amphidinium_carterae.2